MIPAVGAPVGVDAVKQQQEMCFSVISRMADDYYKGGTFDEFVASAPTRDFDAQYGDPALLPEAGWEAASYQANRLVACRRDPARRWRPAGGGQAR